MAALVHVLPQPLKHGQRLRHLWLTHDLYTLSIQVYGTHTICSGWESSTFELASNSLLGALLAGS